MSDAADLKVMSGSVEIGSVYAANPLASDTYYSINTYNDDLMDHKLSELERILNSLGAKRYEITFEEDDNFLSKISASVKRGVSGRAEAELQKLRKRRFERGGTSDGHDPAMPSSLVWFNREPSWQALAESRLRHGRKEFRLIIELEQSLQISAAAKADMKLLRFDMSGDINRNHNIVLSVTGTF